MKPPRSLLRSPQRSRQRLLAAACAAVVLSSSSLPAAAQEPSANGSSQVRLPALGESVSDDLSVASERKLGDQVMREIRRDPDYIDDPQLLDYLQTIWQPLVQAARDRGEIGADTETAFAWEGFLVRDRSINAFALPGGFVGVHLGLIAVTATRDELAAVLAHELSHVTQRHIARSMVNAQRQSIVGLAAILLGAIAAGRSGSADATQAVIVGGQAALQQGQLNFSRDMEREADRVGYGVLSTAGFSPAGVATVFEKLDHAYRLNDSNAYPYLRSHPLTTERIGEARARSAVGTPVPQSAPLTHALMQARARVLMDAREPSLRRVQGFDAVPPGATPSERLGALYASALASTQLRDWARADAALQQALAIVRASPHGDAKAERVLQWQRVQWLVAKGDAARALDAASALQDDGSRTALMIKAQAATASGTARLPQAQAALRQSLEALQTWVAVHPQDASAWTQLAQSADQLGLRLRAIRADAEARAAQGDLSGAIDRLRAGRQIARKATREEFIDASIVEARLREVEAQRRALAAELRGERRGPPQEEPQQ